MNFLENITFRRNRTKSDSNANTSVANMSIEEILNESTNSMPDVSLDASNIDQLFKLREEIEKLKLELHSAHAEIESLSIANNNLKRVNEELTKKSELYKIVAQSPIPKKTKTKTSTKQKSDKQTQTDIQGNYAKEVINKDISKKNSNKSHPMKETNTCKNKNADIVSHRLHVLSSNNNNKVLETLQQTFKGDRYSICHYLKTHCGLQTLLDDVEHITKKLTKIDYFVLMIGEEDFKTTHEYFKLIFSLRETLQKINHTNVIICLPTYKCAAYKDMFNWRIENFNNLLYLDIATHGHAYLLDSNLNLDYSYKMFNYKTGDINNFGIQIVFNDLYKLVNEIQFDNIYLYEDSSMTKVIPTNTEDSDFFRQ